MRALARQTAAQVAAYGELIGGGFSHPAVVSVPGLSLVQTGTWYTPGLVGEAVTVTVTVAVAVASGRGK